MADNPYLKLVDQLDAPPAAPKAEDVNQPVPLVQPSARPAAAAPKANPYDALLEQDEANQKREDALQARLLQWRAANTTTEPARQADVMRYAGASGLAPDFVEKNLDQVKREVDASQVDWPSVFQRQPKLREYLLEQPERTSLVKDDVANLSGIEWAVRAPAKAFSDAFNEQLHVLPRQFAKSKGLLDEEGQKNLEAAQKEYSDKDYGAKSFVGSGVIGLAKMAPMVVMDKLARVGGGLAAGLLGGGEGAGGGAAVGAPVGGAGAVPGAVIGGVGGGVAGAAVGQFAASTLFNYYESVGPLYDRLSKLKDSNGQPMDPAVAHALAEGGGIANGLVMAGFFQLMGSKVPFLNKWLGDAAVQTSSRALAKQTVAAAVKRNLVKYGEDYVVGSMIMGAQSGVNAAAEESAKGLSKMRGQGFDTHWGNVLTASADGFVRGLEDTWLVPLVGPSHDFAVGGRAREFIRDIGLAHRSSLEASRLEAMNAGAAASELLKRSPEEFAKYLQHAAAEDGAAKNVYVPAEEWARYWQGKKVDPGQAAGDVMGDGGKAFAEAQATKGDIAIPVEKYVSKLANTEHAAGLAPDAKLSPETLTPRQAKAEGERQQARMKEEAKTRGAELAAGKEEVLSFVREQAVAAGIGKQEAEANAKLVAEYASTLALRMGVSVQEAAHLGALGQLRVLGPRGEAVAAAARERFARFLHPEASTLLAERLATMSPENRAREVFIDPNTGLLGEKAFHELPPVEGKPLVGHISVEGVKFLNDTVSHDKADLLYRAVGKVLHGLDPQAAKVGGDFAVRVKDAAELQEVVRKVNAEIPVKGFAVTGEAGKTLQEAGAAHGEVKKAAEAAGTRAKRGERPLGFQGDPNAIALPEARASAQVPQELVDRISGLSHGEYFKEAYVEPKSGLLTNEGWSAIPRKAYVASVDLKGLKSINEHLGMTTGDDVLKAFGRLAGHHGGSSYDFAHLHGDEYAAQHGDPAQLEAFLAKLKEKVQDVGVSATVQSTGEKISAKLIAFRHGIGKGSYEAADRELNANKAREPKASGGFPRAESVQAGGPAGGGDHLPGQGNLEAGGASSVDALGRGARPQAWPGDTLHQEVIAHVEGSPVTFRPGGGSSSGGDSGAGSPPPGVGSGGPPGGVVPPLGDVAKGEALAAISRMRPEKQAMAKAWFDFTQGATDKRPEITPDLERQLAKLGVVDPEGYHYGEDGRSLERNLPGRRVFEKEPEALRLDRLQRSRAGYDKATYEQPAWHGSPHDFEQFSTHKIGSGEGNQSFGWGLYFGGKKAVAEYYRKSLVEQLKPQIDGRDFNPDDDREMAAAYALNNGGRAKALARVREILEKSYAPNARTMEQLRAVEKLLASKVDLPEATRPKGQTYKVDVPEHHELLDYDKPLTEQSPKIAKLIRDSYKELGSGAEPINPKLFEQKTTGESFYRMLTEQLGGAQRASEYLAQHGVPGLKYLDEGSRAAKEGSHNFVIWDDARVKVTDKLYQPPKDGDAPRGSIDMQLDPNGRPRSFDVRILNGDKSTFLHETAHFLSWSLHDISQSDLATPDIKADYAKLLLWAGYSSADERLAQTKERTELARKPEADLSFEQQIRATELSAKEERISHGFEQYLLEGKAPSEGLARVFSRFRGWLLDIYRGVQGVQAQYRRTYGEELSLSDEVRGIFDRLLAQSDAIAQAKQNVGHPAEPSPEVSAAMSPAERTEYRNALAAAQLRAERELAAASKEIQGTGLAEERQKVTAEVAQELDSKPVYRAMRFLQRGELVGEDGKLGREAIPDVLLDETGSPMKVQRESFVKQFGKDVARLMPRGMFGATKKAGVPVDELAPMLGFDDGEALVKAFREAVPRDRAIANEAQNRIDTKYGPALKEMAAAAMSAVHNEDSARATLMELRALAKQVNPAAAARARSMDLGVLKDGAARIVSEASVGSLDPARYARAERQTALKAAELWGAGKRAEALDQRESRLWNQLLYRAARDAQEELERAHDKLEGTSEGIRASLGKADPAYRDVHDQVLAAVGLGEGVKGGKSLDELLARAELDVQTVDFDVDAVRQLLAQPKPWESLSVSEARNVADAVANLRHIAKATLEVELAGKRQEKASFLQEISTRLAAVRPPQPAQPYSRTAEGLRDKLRAARRGASSLLQDVETWAEMMDGGTEGPAHRLLIDSRLEARNKEAQLQADVLKPIKKLWESVPKDIRKQRAKRVDVGELLPVPPGAEDLVAPVYTRDQLWSLFLNWGNEGNRQRIRDGNGWTDANVEKALGQLSQPELKFLQGVTDAIETLWPALAESHEKRTGLKLGKVEATPITINGETYRGGYFPLKYDARFSKPGEMQEGDAIKSLFAPNYVRPSVARGHTKAREETVKAPVDLTWGTVPAHFAQVVHDISYGDWIRQTGGILLDKGFKANVTQFLGPERAKELVPWLRDVANSRVDSSAGHVSDFLKSAGGFARSRLALAAIGMNLPALGRHLFDPWTTLSDSEAVGPQYISAAYFKVLNPATWRGNTEPEYGLSKELAYRDTMHKENLRAELGRIAPKGGFSRIVTDVAFSANAFMDHFTSRVTFKAAYDQAMANGLPQDEAVKRADDVVRRALPSGDIAEKPPILRTKHGAAAAVMFYGYASKIFNLRARAFDAAWRTWNTEDAQPADKAAAIATVAAKYLALGLVSSLGAYFAGRGRKEDENPVDWTAKEVLLSPLDDVPLIGPAAKKAVTGHKANIASAPDLAFAEQSLNRLGDAINKSGGRKTDEEKIWSSVETLLSLLGPVGQTHRTVGYLRQVSTGEARPKGPLDVVGGLIYGERKDQPANPATDAQKLVR